MIDSTFRTPGQNPGNTQGLSPAEAEQMAALLKVVADPMRLRILSMIVDLGGADVCACEFPAHLGITQPTASHHLRRLTEAGLLTREQRGKWAFYTIQPARFAQIRDLLGFALLTGTSSAPAADVPILS